MSVISVIRVIIRVNINRVIRVTTTGNRVILGYQPDYHQGYHYQGYYKGFSSGICTRKVIMGNSGVILG